MDSCSLRINEENVLRYLNYRGTEIPQELLEQIRQAKDQLLEIAKPAHVFKVFSLKRDVEITAEAFHGEGVLMLEGTTAFLEGGDIISLLDDCNAVILLATTLGNGVDNLLRKTQLKNMSNAVIIDSCASSAIEEYTNEINRQLEETYESRGLFLTDRFSPGYGDMPVEQQGMLCHLLDTQRRLGLYVTPSQMIIPSKSITALVGIAERPQPKKISGCTSCRMISSCSFQRTGRFCGES